MVPDENPCKKDCYAIYFYWLHVWADQMYKHTYVVTNFKKKMIDRRNFDFFDPQ